MLGSGSHNNVLDTVTREHPNGKAVLPLKKIEDSVDDDTVNFSPRGN